MTPAGMTVALPGAIPAATLVLFRDAAGNSPETMPKILFVERAATMAFAGGAIVFPGGRIDPGDVDRAAAHAHLDRDDAAARVAAIRETHEETALDLGDRVDALVPFARWCPDHKLRVFDTRFYLARAPVGEARVDATENVRLFWATAADVLARASAGSLRIIFPTRCVLERLATFASFEAAACDLHNSIDTVVTPWVETRDGEDRLCIADGHGYPLTSLPLAEAMRA